MSRGFRTTRSSCIVRLSGSPASPVGFMRPGACLARRYETGGGILPRERSKARSLSLDLDFIDISEAKRLNPLIESADYQAAMFDQHDGHVDPSGVTNAYAQAARKAGAEIHKRCPVTAVKKLPGGEWCVETSEGSTRAEYVVNAAGLWAREVGRLFGAELPIVPLEHQYIVTNDVPELAELGREIPAAVDFDGAAYLRQERHGLLLGTYEQNCRHWAVDGTPQDFGVELLPPDAERIAEPLNRVMRRMPALGRAGIKRIVNGGMVFAPDGNPVIGPLPGQPTAFVAAGVMAGFSQAGGVGLAVARWIVHGEPGMDVFAMDVTRFGTFANAAYVLEKTRENYQRRFILPCPNEELEAARPLRTTPVYAELRLRGALFGSAAACEVPLWFADDPEKAHESPSFGRTNAFRPVGEECRAVREAVGLWETSSYCKIEVSGPAAAAWLDEVVANRIPRVGRVALCPMLTPSGRLLGDVSVAHLSDDRMLLMGSPAAERLYLRWLTAQPGAERVRIVPRTNELCGFAVTGPRSRELLGRICREDVSNAAFPFLTVRELTVSLAPVTALRISFTGELGYELYMSSDYQRHVYNTLMKAGGELGLRPFGLRALNALRLEKAYGGWGREYTQDYTPVEAGLNALLKVEKPAFVGREALLRQLSAAPLKRLRLLAIRSQDPDPVGGEPVLYTGKAVGRLTSAAFGYTVGYSLGLAYLPAEFSPLTEDLEIELLSARLPARVLNAAPYDPTGAKLRA